MFCRSLKLGVFLSKRKLNEAKTQILKKKTACEKNNAFYLNKNL